MKKCLLVSDFCDQFLYLLNLTRPSPETVRSYKSKLNEFKAFLEEKKIKKLTTITDDTIEKFIEHLQTTKKINTVTVNNSLRFVRRFLNTAHEKKYIKNQVKVKLLRQGEIIKDTFNDKEFKTMVNDKTITKIGVMTKLFLAIGVRSRTMCNIKVDDIDFKTKTITCRITKNKKILILPMVKSVARLLKEYIKIFELSDNDYLFTNKYGRQFNRKTIESNINKYLASVGITKRGVHIFRHTFAKKMALAGAGTYILSSWLGDTAEVAENYIRIFASDLKITAEKFNPVASFRLIQEKATRK